MHQPSLLFKHQPPLTPYAFFTQASTKSAKSAKKAAGGKARAAAQKESLRAKLHKREEAKKKDERRRQIESEVAERRAELGLATLAAGAARTTAGCVGAADDAALKAERSAEELLLEEAKKDAQAKSKRKVPQNIN